MKKLTPAEHNALRSVARACNSEMIEQIAKKAAEFKLMGLSAAAGKAAAYQMLVPSIIDKHHKIAQLKFGLSRIEFMWYIGKHINDRFGREDDEEVRRDEEREWQQC